MNLTSLEMCQRTAKMYIKVSTFENHIRQKRSPYCNPLCLYAKQSKNEANREDSGYPLVKMNAPATVNGKLLVNITHNELITNGLT